MIKNLNETNLTPEQIKSIVITGIDTALKLQNSSTPITNLSVEEQKDILIKLARGKEVLGLLLLSPIDVLKEILPDSVFNCTDTVDGVSVKLSLGKPTFVATSLAPNLRELQKDYSLPDELFEDKTGTYWVKKELQKAYDNKTNEVMDAINAKALVCDYKTPKQVKVTLK